MPTRNIALDTEELQILNTIESPQRARKPLTKKQKTEIAQSATLTLSKKKPVNIRLFEADIYRVKRKALEEGIPYQTLLSSVIHKYAHGALK